MNTITDLVRALESDAERIATPHNVEKLRQRILNPSANDARTAAAPAARDFDIRPAPAALPRRRRPVMAFAAAAALVAAVAGTAGAALQHRSPADTAPAAASPLSALSLDTYAFSVTADPGGLTFQAGGTTTNLQGGFWSDPTSGTTLAAVNVAASDAGVGAQSRPSGADDIAVHGNAGWTAPLPATTDLYWGLDRSDSDLTVWHDQSSGLWAGLITAGLDKSRISQLADAVRLGDSRPVTFPVRVPDLPGGIQLTAVNFGLDHLARAEFGAHGNQLSITVTPAGAQHVNYTGTATLQHLTVNGFSSNYHADDPTTVFTNGTVDIAVDNGDESSNPALSAQDLTKLMSTVSVAPAAGDTRSWFTVEDALPTAG